jgi:hypothetical protein
VIGRYGLGSQRVLGKERGLKGFLVFKNAEDDVEEFAHDGDMWTNVKTPNTKRQTL